MPSLPSCLTLPYLTCTFPSLPTLLYHTSPYLPSYPHLALPHLLNCTFPLYLTSPHLSFLSLLSYLTSPPLLTCAFLPTRYCAVTSPLHYSMTITRGRSVRLIVGVWTLALLYALPQLLAHTYAHARPASRLSACPSGK